MGMPCGNSAALNGYEHKQAQREYSQHELDKKVDQRVEEIMASDAEQVIDALVENPDAVKALMSICLSECRDINALTYEQTLRLAVNDRELNMQIESYLTETNEVLAE